MTPKQVADVMPGAKHNNVKYLMWAMLGDGQLLKDDKGRYSPANPTNRPTNPKKAHSYAGNDDRVSGVSEDSGVGTSTYRRTNEKTLLDEDDPGVNL